MPGLQCKMKTAVACRSSMSWWHNDTCCTSLLKKVVLKQLLRWPRWPQLRRTVATGYVEICRDVEICGAQMCTVCSFGGLGMAGTGRLGQGEANHDEPPQHCVEKAISFSVCKKSLNPISSYIYIYTVYVRLFAQHFHLSFLEGSCVVLCQHLSWNQLSTPTRLAAPHLQRPDQGHNRHSTQRGKSTGSSRPVLVGKKWKKDRYFCLRTDYLTPLQRLAKRTCLGLAKHPSYIIWYIWYIYIYMIYVIDIVIFTLYSYIFLHILTIFLLWFS